MKKKFKNTNTHIRTIHDNLTQRFNKKKKLQADSNIAQLVYLQIIIKMSNELPSMAGKLRLNLNAN